MIIETERLILRPFEPRDNAPYARINGDPETMRYFDHPFTRAETDASIERSQLGLTKNGFHFLATELEATGEFIGVLGLGKFDQVTRDAIPGHPQVEIGWRLRRDMWGQGLAPEGALACLQYAWGKLDLDEVVAITYRGNTPSRRVMDKIGMAHDPEGDFNHPLVQPGHHLRAHVLYRIFNPGRTQN